MRKKLGYIGPQILKSEFALYAIIILYLYKIILHKYIPYQILNITRIVFCILTLILFFFNIVRFFFFSYSKHNLQKQISELHSNYNSIDETEYHDNLSWLEYQLNRVQEKKYVINVLKSKSEFSGEKNYSKYIYIIFILPLISYALNIMHLGKTFVFVFLVMICLLFCLYIISLEIIKNKNLLSNNIIIHGFFIIILLFFVKPDIINHFGNDTIGSLFEKPEYNSKYYVKIYPVENRKSEKIAPADIHVFTETELDESGEDRYGNETYSDYKTKYVTINKVYYDIDEVLIFKGCQFEIGESNSCKDQFSNSWNIELTKIKVK